MKTKTISRDKLISELNKIFPKMWTKPGEEFRSDYKNSIWIGEGSYISINNSSGEILEDDFDTPMFHSWNESDYSYFGVHVDLVEFLDQYELYVEARDGGNYFIFIH